MGILIGIAIVLILAALIPTLRQSGSSEDDGPPYNPSLFNDLNDEKTEDPDDDDKDNRG